MSSGSGLTDKTSVKKSFSEKLTSNPQDWISCVFYSICIVIFILISTNFDLTSFDRRIISRATAENFDIAYRVNLYYLLVFLFVFLGIFFKIAAIKLNLYLISSERTLINYASLCGLLFLLFGAFTAIIANMPVFMVLATHGILLLKVIFRIFQKKKESFSENLSYDVFLFSVLSSIALYILYKRISLILDNTTFLNFYIFLLLSGTIIYISLWSQLVKHTDIAKDETWFYNMLRYLKPLAWAPFIVVLTSEIYLFINHKNIYSISPNLIFIVLIALMFLWFLFERFRKTNTEIKKRDYRKLLFRYYFPVFFAGMTAFFLYMPVLNETQDLYEIANSSLTIQQYYEFNKIPFIDTFNTHELSETLLPFIYTVIYGYSDLSFLLFNFLHEVFAIFLIYFLFLKYTRNPYITITSILFFPFLNIIFPPYYYSALLFPLILIYSIKRQTTKSFFLLFCTILFLIFWKIDIGFACFFSGLITIIIYVFAHYKTQLNFKALVKGFIYFIMLCIIIFAVFYLIFGNKFIVSIDDVLSFYNSVQAYGFPDLAEISNVFYYLVHYFVFPIIIVCLILYSVIVLFKQAGHSDKSSKVLIIYIFIGLFYLMNFQRGLVRHCLIENTDHTLTSFGFFLLGGSIFLYKSSLSETKKFIFFTILSSVLVLAFKFPPNAVRKTSLFGQFVEKTDSFPVINESDHMIPRAIEDTLYARKNYNDLVLFLKTNLKPDETFIDFTNSPMIYFYAHRENPFYFNQSLYNAHDEYLQKRFIEQALQHKTLFVLFSKYPVSSGDNLDGIPNAARHYLIAEFIYLHYKPYAYINNFCIWKRNDLNRCDSMNILDSFKVNEIQDDNDTQSKSSEKRVIEFKLKNKILLDDHKSLFVSINYSAKKSTEVMLNYILNDTVQCYPFDVCPDSSVKLIGLKKYPGEELKEVQIQIPPESEIVIKNISVIDADHTPDVFSARTINFSGLKYIPYVWGQYDIKSSGSAPKKLITLTSSHIELKTGKGKKFFFNPVTDKNNGNYLVIKALNQTNEIPEITIIYGKGNDTNGSFTFYMMNNEKLNIYILRMSTQYNWMAIDNNWISLSSTGDISIQSIDITEAD